MISVQVLHGDCRDELELLPDNSIDSIVTDPPYELGFMGKSWDASGIAYDQRVWVQCLRVLKPGGHMLAFSGSRTYHRMVCAIEDAGFQIRDQIMWVYGSGFPKSHSIGKAIDKVGGIEAQQWDGWGTALKPAHEPIVMARKPIEGTVANNVLTHGVGGINIDGCRVGRVDGDDSSAGNRTATFGTQETMSGGDGSGGWSQNSEGRFPANFIHDGSDEVLALFPDTKGGTWNTTKGARHFNNDGEPTGYATSKQDSTTGSAARFFYCAKAGKAERNAGLEALPSVRASAMGYERGLGDAGEGMIKDRNPQKQNFHPTVKPLALMRYLVRLVTPPNGIVLDPFAGSGTTLVAATMEKFDCIGIEMTDEYLPIIEARVAHATTDTLF